MLQIPPNEPIPGQSGDQPPDGAGTAAQPGSLTPPEEVSAEDFEASYGEPLERTLNLETWERGENLDRMFERLDREISEALEREDALYKQLRKVVFPQITSRPNAPPGTEGSVAYTHFDTPSSEDHAITILLTKEHMNRLPSQTLVRIKSLTENNELDRIYLGTVVAGPFAEPDGFRTDSPLVVTTTVQGGIFLPRYHGRAYVQILGEESDGQVIPPRYRPKPNSRG